jgi:hypothetical protein
VVTGLGMERYYRKPAEGARARPVGGSLGWTWNSIHQYQHQGGGAFRFLLLMDGLVGNICVVAFGPRGFVLMDPGTQCRV